MDNRIEELNPTTVMGQTLEMSLTHDKTRELWQSFGPLVKSIPRRKDGNLISMQIYRDPLDPQNFDPKALFSKWAAVVIKPDSDENGDIFTDELAENSELKTYTIQGGLYAVFKHIGPASEFRRSMNFIFGEWFPASNYALDHREHFEILPPGYRPDDPEATEEIWIPITKKSSIGT